MEKEDIESIELKWTANATDARDRDKYHYRYYCYFDTI